MRVDTIRLKVAMNTATQGGIAPVALPFLVLPSRVLERP